jgi:hypothetical protein
MAATVPAASHEAWACFSSRRRGECRVARTTSVAVALCKEFVRDRARQDVAPGASMDGFTAIPNKLFAERNGTEALFERHRRIR